MKTIWRFSNHYFLFHISFHSSNSSFSTSLYIIGIKPYFSSYYSTLSFTRLLTHLYRLFLLSLFPFLSSLFFVLFYFILFCLHCYKYYKFLNLIYVLILCSFPFSSSSRPFPISCLFLFSLFPSPSIILIRTIWFTPFKIFYYF